MDKDIIYRRVNKDEYYLNIAREVSSRSTCVKRQYGCVIVNNDEIIATGYNGAPRGEMNCSDVGYCTRMNVRHNSGDYSDCHAVHAEQNALISAARRDMINGILYLYGSDFNLGDKYEIDNPEPCPICLRMIKNSGITKIVTKSKVMEV